MRRFVLLFTSSYIFAATPALMPWPSKYEAGVGQLPITASFDIAFTTREYDPVLQAAASRLKREIGLETGITFGQPGTGKPALLVKVGTPLKGTLGLGEDESYKLSVTASGATLTAPSALGVLRGFATIAQSVVPVETGFALPAAEIVDTPRFPWRGLHIDVSRHFFPLAVIERNLDGMAAVKLNVFHWHLSDNQGFRIESKRFPKLHQQGSDGLYYTQDQVREVIKYAHDRGIRVVPEFDIPGHSTSWLVGYPELAAGPGPFSIGRTWGVFDPVMDPTNEAVYTFLDAFLGEMAALFPDEYFHIGGDEVNGLQWNANKKIAVFKREHGMLGSGIPSRQQQVASNEQLQAYFNSRVEPLVRKHGKKMMGWDEILAPSLPKAILIQSWRGQESLADAVRQGFRGILSSGYYLDLAQSAEQHYLIDPMINPKTKQVLTLTPEEQARILGGEACMWSEYVSEETVDSRIWPRTAAIAERLWSSASIRDLDSMYSRLESVSRKLDSLGLTHNSNYGAMLARIAPGADLTPLVNFVEPVKGYARSSSGTNYTQQTPLNRLVDAARPESMPSRRFADNVAKQNWSAVRTNLEAWKAFQLPSLPTVQEAAPVASNLRLLGTIGLEALEYRENSRTAPSAWVKTRIAELTTMKKPHAELLLIPVDAVLSIVKSVAPR